MDWRHRSLRKRLSTVMPGLVPGIHALLCDKKGVDGRNKSGHDERWLSAIAGRVN
jgi:hypothetical protein